MQEHLSFPPNFLLGFWGGCIREGGSALVDEKVVEAIRHVGGGAVFVGELECLQDYFPHLVRKLGCFFGIEEVSVLIEDVWAVIPTTCDGFSLLRNVEDGIILCPVDPVGAEVSHMAVWKPVLLHAAPNPIPALKDRDFEAVLKEDVGAPQARKTGTYNCHMRSVREISYPELIPR